MFKNKFYVIGLFTSFMLCASFGKQTADAPIKIIFKQKNTKIKVDALGNIYEISEMQISKYNNLGVFLKSFSSKQHGVINFVDVSNPLKILVYYKEFQQILFLDNQLSISSNVIALENLGYEQTELVCTSSNNSFWLFDKQNNSLLRFSSDSKLLVKTGNLKTLLGANINPNFMLEHNGYLYLNAGNEEGIMLFDIYGTFYKAIAITQLSEFWVVNDDVFYFKQKLLHQYQPLTFNTIQKQFADTSIKQVYWHNNQFYKVYPDSLIITPEL